MSATGRSPGSRRGSITRALPAGCAHLPQQQQCGRHLARAYEHPARLRHLPQLPGLDLIRLRHTSAAYPGTHRAALSCASCHTSNTDQVPYPSAANPGTCAGCHAKDFKPARTPRPSRVPTTPPVSWQLQWCLPRLQRYDAVNNYKESARTASPSLGCDVPSLMCLGAGLEPAWGLPKGFSYHYSFRCCTLRMHLWSGLYLCRPVNTRFAHTD